MNRAKAPLYTDVASLPAGGEAMFVYGPDDRRVRVARWLGSDPALGKILIFPGRTEYVEKYHTTITSLVAAGFGVVVVDWRGQGLSERTIKTSHGHVRRFAEYQNDLEAALPLVDELPGPLQVLAHSMGGAIALRALSTGRLCEPGRVQRVVFSAPMLGLVFGNPVLNAVIPFLMRLSAAFGRGRRPTPGSPELMTAERVPFKTNRLTSSFERFEWMRETVKAKPLLRTGGTTVGWLVAAFDEVAELAEAPAPQLPTLCILGTDERVVSIPILLGQLERMNKPTLLRVEGARHEPLFDSDEITAAVWPKVAAFLRGEPI